VVDLSHLREDRQIEYAHGRAFCTPQSLIPMAKNDSDNIGKYIELVLLLPVSTMVGMAIGYGLDRLFGMHFLYIIFMVLGTTAGIIQLIRELS
jgi:F0F1-type ATP synthase assembly protein I